MVCSLSPWVPLIKPSQTFLFFDLSLIMLWFDVLTGKKGPPPAVPARPRYFQPILPPTVSPPPIPYSGDKAGHSNSSDSALGSPDFITTDTATAGDDDDDDNSGDELDASGESVSCTPPLVFHTLFMSRVIPLLSHAPSSGRSDCKGRSKVMDPRCSEWKRF